MIKLASLPVALTTLVLSTAMATPAPAKAILTLPLDLGTDGTVRSIEYSCADGTDVSVQYINIKGNSLAIIPLAGEDLIFVNVVSGSGARYVSGAREWWTKDDEATLRDQMSDAAPVKCTAKPTQAAKD